MDIQFPLWKNHKGRLYCKRLQWLWKKKQTFSESIFNGIVLAEGKQVERHVVKFSTFTIFRKNEFFTVWQLLSISLAILKLGGNLERVMIGVDFTSSKV